MPDHRSYESIVPDYAGFAQKIGRRLQFIYPALFHEGLINRIMAMCNHRYPGWPKWSEQDIMMITYANTITTQSELPLQTLERFLSEKITPVINSVHILPFFPYTSDDGFAVSDFNHVNPDLGSWDDIVSLSEKFSLMSDLVINHVSSEHPWFRNYLQGKSPGKDYFIEAEPGMDYGMVTRPRSSALFTRFETAEGQKDVWTTFGTDQVDLNYSNPEVLLEMIRVMLFYISKGVRFIRLDAIAFLWKCNGTTCLHLDETHEIVKLLRDIALFVRPGTVILTETNVPNRENWSYFGRGDEAHMVYQFSLPPLLLHALFTENSKYLKDWSFQIPEVASDQSFLNYTASHDGIGVRPLEGLLPETALKSLIEGMQKFGGMISMKLNKDGTLGPYEINIAWFDAMKGTMAGPDDLQIERFLCSQAVMMSLKGIPAFYIHSLLATPNDHRGVELTGRARSINRKQLDLAETLQSLERDSVQAKVFNELLRMVNIRKQHPAFHPQSKQAILQTDNAVFAFMRHSESMGEKIYCIANVTPAQTKVNIETGRNDPGMDLLTGEKIMLSKAVLLNPLQVRWIVESNDGK